MTAPNSGLVVIQGDELKALIRESLAECVAETLADRETKPSLLDRRGLAVALGVCIDVVDRLRREGLPELTVGDAPRFELERCLEWLRGRK